MIHYTMPPIYRSQTVLTVASLLLSIVVALGAFHTQDLIIPIESKFLNGVGSLSYLHNKVFYNKEGLFLKILVKYISCGPSQCGWASFK
jgi:uncharacterized membrane protein